MSKSNRSSISARLPKDLLRAVRRYCAFREANGVVSPWTLTDFIEHAIAEKLKHIERSSKKKWKALQAALEIDLIPQEVLDHMDDLTITIPELSL
jgi:hypothetical protein